VALGASDAELSMHVHDNHTPSSSILDATEACHELYPETRDESLTLVKLTTLDEVMRKRLPALDQPVLFKLDVQGYEDRVLAGAKLVLTRCAYVLLEVNLDRLYDKQAEFHSLSNMLHSAGFQ